VRSHALRAKKPDNAVFVKANWRENPWFPDTLDEERRTDLKLYPERYAHIGEGDYARAFEGAYMMRIEAGRRVFPRCWFNESTTESGRDALGYYHER
jgi:hypothetical protein